MDKHKVAELRAFIDLVKKDASVLNLPELAFFRDYLTSLGAKIPQSMHEDPEEEEFHDFEREESLVDPPAPLEEDFIDASDSGKLSQETDPLPKITTPKELTDAEQDKVNDLKARATDAVEGGDVTAAITLLSEAISLGGGTAMVLTKRAELLLKSKRPLAAIADCDAALGLNPDSAKAYRIRGLAFRGLQKWSKAHSDLANAQKIDFDDNTETVKKFVDEKWKLYSEAVREHRIKCEENARLRKEQQRSKSPRHGPAGGFQGGMPGGFPGGMPGGFPGGMPGGFPTNLMGDLLNDPEMMAAMSNPRVMAAFQSMMTNPASILQYQSDPEIGPILMKLMSKMGGAGFGR